MTLEFIYNDKSRIASPYKMLNLNGIWYLVAVQNETIKNFTISKISNLKIGDKLKKSLNLNLLSKKIGLLFQKI